MTLHKAKKGDKIRLLNRQYISEKEGYIPIGEILICTRADNSLSFIQGTTEDLCNSCLLAEHEYELYKEEIVFKDLYYDIPDKKMVPAIIKWMESIGRETKYPKIDEIINYLFVESATKGFHFGYSLNTDIHRPINDLYKLGFPSDWSNVKYVSPTVEETYAIGDRVIVGEANLPCPGWEDSIGIVVGVNANAKSKYCYYVQGENNDYILYTEIKRHAPKKPIPDIYNPNTFGKTTPSSSRPTPKFKKLDVVKVDIYHGEYVVRASELDETNTYFYALEHTGIVEHKLFGISENRISFAPILMPESINPCKEIPLLPDCKFKIGDWVNYGKYIFNVTSIRYSGGHKEYLIHGKAYKHNYSCVESSLSLHTRFIGEANNNERINPRVSELEQVENVSMIDTNVTRTKPLTQELASQQSVYYF